MIGKQLTILSLVGLLASAVFAQAGDTVPWKGVTSGITSLIPWADGTVVVEAGSSAHLGEFTEIGWEDGRIEITAANGDKLLGFSEILDISPDYTLAHVRITFTGGTGRFDNAKGGYIGTLQLTLIDASTFTFAFTGTSTGTISTVGSNKKN